MGIEPCPPSGGGVHTWLLHAANRLRHDMSADQAAAWLRQETADCGRTVTEREIQAALRKAFSDARLSVTAPPRKRLEPSPRLLAAVNYSNGLAELWQASPWPCNVRPADSEYLVSALFPDDALVCCGTKIDCAETKPLSEWKGKLHTQQYIVPNPMSALTGKTQDGKVSKRCIDNTGPRRFINVEFDIGDVDNQAAKVLYLMQMAPLAMTCHSGGKSLHNWFFVEGLPDDFVDRVFNAAISLGADPANRVKCQFARMPEGLRDGHIRQAIFYFNPEVVQ